MCGIFGYVGQEDPLPICIEGLKKLEYRGYDSTGIAGISKGKLEACKGSGKIANLEKKIRLMDLKLDLSIGHTRWATHGKPSDQNAHPHFDSSASIALVHNGITENYDVLREELRSKGVQFASETDTEVIVQLIASLYQGDLLLAVQGALKQLRGSFAIALIHKSHPDQIIAAARENPLCVGFNDAKTEALVSSDPNAFSPSIPNVFFLHRDEIAVVSAKKIELFDINLKKIDKKPERLENDGKACSKEGFEHFMLKEIFEQPQTVQKALEGRFSDADVCLEPLQFSDEEVRNVQRVWLIGCGTSANAGWLASLLLEELAGTLASVEIASEARYRNPLLFPKPLVIAISQSGETADTISALREAKAKGCRVLGICNVKNSTLSREADSTLFLKAGPEISVCSTKAFTSQVALLTLVALHLARVKGMKDQEMRKIFAELKKIPEQIQQVLDRFDEIKQIAKKYAQYDDFFFMGRRYMLPTCLEAALKLKEISYVNANGYPGGELKHGPIALLNPRFPVIAFCANQQTHDKIASNLMEVKARGAPVLAFTSDKSLDSIADDVFHLPQTLDILAPFTSAIAGQLFAYCIAKMRGCDIDQPRNLAKSVTVE